MQTHLRKAFWWAALAIGLGGTILFAIFLVATGTLPRHADVFVWPGISVPLSIVSQWRLRSCYREAPITGGGKWQLSLTDMFAVLFMTGLILSLFQTVMPMFFIQVGVPFGVANGLVLPIGILVAARKGLSKGWIRYFYALGLSGSLIGGLVVGAFTTILIIGSLMARISVVRVLNEILDASPASPNEWPNEFIRMGMFSLLYGLCFTGMAQKLGRES